MSNGYQILAPTGDPCPWTARYSPEEAWRALLDGHMEVKPLAIKEGYRVEAAAFVVRRAA